jgi:ubiquinone/menaquinone biosynthesis C-methylase UbiE
MSNKSPAQDDSSGRGYPAEFWSQTAPGWDEAISRVESPYYFYYFEADLLISELLHGCGTALELGCGTGGATLHASRPGLRIVAVDYSREMIRRAKKRVSSRGVESPSSIELATADVSMLPFASQTFDAVFSRGVVLSYVSDLRLCLDELFRVLRPGGRVGIDFMHLVKPHRRALLASILNVDGQDFFSEGTDDGIWITRQTCKLKEGWEAVAIAKSFREHPSELDPFLFDCKSGAYRYIKRTEMSRSLRRAGFKRISFQPLGCFWRLARNRSRDENLVRWALNSRDMLSTLQIRFPELFDIRTAPHVFALATKPA